MTNEILNELASYGLHPKNIITDGKIHRFSTNGKAGDTAGYYIFKQLSSMITGGFGCWRNDIHEGYNSKSFNHMSNLERLEVEKEQKRQERIKAIERKKEQEAAAIKAAEIMDKVSRDIAHPYIERKQIELLGGAGVYDGVLYVPCYNKAMQLVNVEHIYAKKGATKHPLAGGERKGTFCIIGDIPEEGKNIILTEGYATGVSLHMATKLCVIVAFSAGNLPSAIEHFKKHAVIIAADNDEGEAGINAAEKARAIHKNAIIRLCPIHSDFNDLHVAQGLQAVRECIFPPTTTIKNESTTEQKTQSDDAPFKTLGRFAGQCYYIPQDGYIYSYSPAAHNKNVLLALASNQYWVSQFPNDKGTAIDVDEAISHLLSLSERITFNPALRRGRGAWIDDGKIIIHQGETIMDVASGDICDVMDFASEYFYPKAPKTIKKRQSPLSDGDCKKILDICQMLPLDNPINAYLLAGWLVCAQINGVMPWRPHIWLTGRRGSGKSWIMSNIMMPLMGNNVLQVQSTTTEAGIRQTLQGDAFSVLFDEIEGTDTTARNRIQRVLELARQSSSENGGVIAKGTQGGSAMAFTIRSCFCFSSILSGVVQASDKSRVTEIEIDAKKYGSNEKFAALKDMVKDTISSDYANGFYWRCVKNAETIRHNTKSFSEACGDFFGDKRAGDQFGALLAGALSLTANQKIDYNYAMTWLRATESQGVWKQHNEDVDCESDEQKCLDSIMQAQIIHLGRIDRVWQLIEECKEGLDVNSQKNTLLSYGIKIENDLLYIANSCENLKRALKDTPFSENWGKTLKRLHNAKPSVGSVRFGGFSVRATVIMSQM
jgi:putative DNA primase/helicase